MMTKNVMFLLFISIAALLAGCKLAVINVEGGEVQSIGSGTCAAGTVCMINVADTTFSEAFAAVPDEGWYFHKWNTGGRFLCGNSSNPECRLSFEGLQGQEEIEALVASSEVFYLMPVFRNYPRATLVEGQLRVIAVDGKKWEWLHPKEFLGYSYDQIAAVCPLPSGKCSGLLKDSDVDLKGYFWASEDDIVSLFQAFAAKPPYYSLSEQDMPFLGSMVENSGFFQHFESYNRGPGGGGVVGQLRNRRGAYAEVWENFDENYFLMAIATSPDDPGFLETTGAWFWRPVE